MRTSDIDRYFSPSYEEARRRFLDAASAVGARLQSLPLTSRGPDREALAIDIAWIGSRTPQRVVLHCSGMHGVEGFTGSAIQIRALNDLSPVEDQHAVIFVHVLNPFGMAWLRRCNEHNVDLNRNWLEPGAVGSGISDVYRAIDRFLNPTAMGFWDMYHARAFVIMLKYGVGPLRQAIAGGQYEKPCGLFYGGRQREEGPVVFSSWLRSELSAAERVWVIDVHTGLGKWRQSSLFYQLFAMDEDALPTEVRADIAPAFEQSDVGGYAVRAGHVSVYRQLFGDRPLSFVTQELGTYSAVRVLGALRLENYQHHFGGPEADQRSKRALKDVFCPPSATWRVGALDDGVTVLRATQRTALG